MTNGSDLSEEDTAIMLAVRMIERLKGLDDGLYDLTQTLKILVDEISLMRIRMKE